MKNRKLVIRNEAAGHPLRRMLPPLSGGELAVAGASAQWWKREDTHLFVMSFVAFFIVFYSFIA